MMQYKSKYKTRVSLHGSSTKTLKICYIESQQSYLENATQKSKEKKAYKINKWKENGAEACVASNML